MPAERLAQTCAVPACEARTLRTYCTRCEINGQAAEHEARRRTQEANRG